MNPEDTDQYKLTVTSDNNTAHDVHISATNDSETFQIVDMTTANSIVASSGGGGWPTTVTKQYSASRVIQSEAEWNEFVGEFDDVDSSSTLGAHSLKYPCLAVAISISAGGPSATTFIHTVGSDDSENLVHLIAQQVILKKGIEEALVELTATIGCPQCGMRLECEDDCDYETKKPIGMLKLDSLRNAIKALKKAKSYELEGGTVDKG